mgnify:FL=1
MKEYEMSNITSNSLLSNNEFISNNYLKSNNSNNVFSSVSFYELNSEINPDIDLNSNNKDTNSNYISINQMNNFDKISELSYNTRNSNNTDIYKSLSNITNISDNEI